MLVGPITEDFDAGVALFLTSGRHTPYTVRQYTAEWDLKYRQIAIGDLRRARPRPQRPSPSLPVVD